MSNHSSYKLLITVAIAWQRSVDQKITGERIQFKLDTGTEVTAVSEATQGSQPIESYQDPTRASRSTPEGVGQFTKKIIHTSSKISSNEVVFVQDLKSNLLSRIPSDSELLLIKRVDLVNAEGLGTGDGRYRSDL